MSAYMSTNIRSPNHVIGLKGCSPIWAAVPKERQSAVHSSTNWPCFPFLQALAEIGEELGGIAGEGRRKGNFPTGER